MLDMRGEVSLQNINKRLRNMHKVAGLRVAELRVLKDRSLEQIEARNV